MKVLFLDIDGVLNSNRTCLVWGHASGSERRILPPTRNWEGEKFIHDDICLDPIAVEILRLLVATTHCKIVISSDWRKQSCVAAFHALFDVYNWDTREIIIGMTGVNRQVGAVRGHEIHKWLMEHPEVTEYAIVDDNTDMLPEQMLRFVKTCPSVGLDAMSFDQLLEVFGNDIHDAIQTRKSLPVHV